jgi:hypothetical protein
LLEKKVRNYLFIRKKSDDHFVYRCRDTILFSWLGAVRPSPGLRNVLNPKENLEIAACAANPRSIVQPGRSVMPMQHASEVQAGLMSLFALSSKPWPVPAA